MATDHSSPFSLARIPSMRLGGRAIRALSSISRTSLGASLLKKQLADQLGLAAIARLPESARGPLVLDPRPIAGRPPRTGAPAANAFVVENRGWPKTSSWYREHYESGELTPRAQCEQLLTFAADLEKAMAPSGGPLLERDDAALRRDADASTRRWAARAPLSPFDGVPFAVKEELDVKGLHTRAGTAFLGESPAGSDATVVARLRAAGAIVLGSTPMTEYGMTTFGGNAHRKMPRNPHSPLRGAGGSSTGSGVAVATGLCPFAIGADGGGSIRIPSAHNGVFGIKPTFGRVSRGGDVFGGTMDHVGPIASSVADLARFFDLCAGPDERDSATGYAPVNHVDFSASLTRGVAGLRIGLPEELWADADPAVAKAGRAALASLERAGAVLVPVDIPLADASTAIGYLSIALEVFAEMRSFRLERRSSLSHDFALFLDTLSALGPADYLDAQRLRTALRHQTASAFQSVDLLALPTTCRPAPPLNDDERASGVLDPANLHANCRTNMFGNLTGLPAASAPVGSEEGIPIGLQLIGDAWDEPTVLAALATLERTGAARVVKPLVSVG